MYWRVKTKCAGEIQYIEYNIVQLGGMRKHRMVRFPGSAEGRSRDPGVDRPKNIAA